MQIWNIVVVNCVKVVAPEVGSHEASEHLTTNNPTNTDLQPSYVTLSTNHVTNKPGEILLPSGCPDGRLGH